MNGLLDGVPATILDWDLQMPQNETEVQRVMRETGMQELQAYRHVQQRQYLQTVPKELTTQQLAELKKTPIQNDTR